MKIKLESDLHIDIRKYYKKSYKPDLNGIDVYVLAGDVAQGLGAIDYCIELSKEFSDCYIIHVGGNHFYYDNQFFSLDDEARKKLNNNDKVFHLENESIAINNIRFICSTMWTSINNENQRDIFNVNRGLNDYRYIMSGNNAITPYHTINKSRESISYIFNEMEKSEEKTIVVTHHKPFKSKFPTTLAPAFEEDLSKNIKNCKQKPIMWFYGHVHNHEDINKHGVRFLCNCLGYPDEITDFKDDLVIEV